ncbi:unnamed protein product [Arabidopsis thaliana]|jgi:hypothetical protein|uniref:At2g44240/F4I1.5 n=2 Tax=Arabidopsis thaliana TaxID=3702 RepID=O64859_ARATH|nr:NEP-interacting protein (DUF239) [Arabidopsis thaliana]AAC16103.2 expressed protein [Arabidopsis thaliana]AAL16182.1 At2g44240/F4I1.5 [Arabidopsis thaliana]AAM78062.1 At2g44240/F4I1.5 [Arabidopsis thaliana]AEC10395.1 NEP-interacting protein (DUF239) [Arabidopsis thaliana]CAD5321330.1 unnamed protein product [Arabidopsis thaliana]|eukprot:NP_030962.1 NEP-interacting protein (DUF239) [Arabidopsis thaliana]
MMGVAGFAVALMVTSLLIATCADGKEFFHHREIKVQRFLKQLNKPALKSIKSEDGDIIDCVLITSQPAFDHPLLKNHTIQVKPSFIPEGEGDSTYTKKETKATQVWQKYGECPENTIPIRRTKKEEILRAKSLESFGKKNHQYIPEDTSSPNYHHEYAFMGVRNGKFYGTKASINVWKPDVATPSEFSLSQTWIVSGDGTSRNTIEAGWQVYPGMYGNNDPRLFVYWTSDGYQKTGCYNLVCGGFVQTTNQYTVGGSYVTASQYDGAQLVLNLLIWKDPKTGNWWLKINDNDVIGYWPGSLFNSLGDGAIKVEWGGEIFAPTSDRHTTTDMGSGHFAEEGIKKASYVKNIMIVDGTNALREPQGLYSYADNRNCYSVVPGNAGTSFGTHFFYGGPGQNVKCP